MRIAYALTSFLATSSCINKTGKLHIKLHENSVVRNIFLTAYTKGVLLSIGLDEQTTCHHEVDAALHVNQ